MPAKPPRAEPESLACDIGRMFCDPQCGHLRLIEFSDGLAQCAIDQDGKKPQQSGNCWGFIRNRALEVLGGFEASAPQCSVMSYVAEKFWNRAQPRRPD